MVKEGKIGSWILAFLILASLIVYSPQKVHAAGFSWNTQAYWGSSNREHDHRNVVEVHASASISQELLWGGDTPDPCDDVYKNTGTLTFELRRVSGGWLNIPHGWIAISAKNGCDKPEIPDDERKPGQVAKSAGFTTFSTSPDRIYIVSSLSGQSGRIDSGEGFIGWVHNMQVANNAWVAYYMYFHHLNDVCSWTSGPTFVCWGSPISTSESEWGHSYVSEYVWNTQSFWGGSENNVVQVCGKARLNKLDSGSYFDLDLVIERISGANLGNYSWDFTVARNLQENYVIVSQSGLRKIYQESTPSRLILKFKTPESYTWIPPGDHIIGLLYGYVPSSPYPPFFFKTDYKSTIHLPTSQSRNPSSTCHPPPVICKNMSISMQPENPKVGEPITITATITDEGGTPVPGLTLTFTLTLPDGSTVVLAWTDNGDGTYTATYVPDKPGSYGLNVAADGIVLCEGGGGNSKDLNFEVIKPLPDLIVYPFEIKVKSNFSLPGIDLKIGWKATIEVTIHNIGDADAGPFTARVIILLDGEEEEVHDVTISGLKANESTMFTIEEWIPLYSGDYVIRVILDPDVSNSKVI